jgi:hypothetical protein
MTEPIRKSVTVPLGPAAAFDLFTAGIDRWWPKATHSLSEDDGARVRVEPRVGGQVIETRPDGSEVPWARVVQWEPGARLGLAWHVGRAEEDHTDVDVTFTATEAGTRVDVVHGGFDRLADAPGMQANYTRGWDHVLGERFAAACALAA